MNASPWSRRGDWLGMLVVLALAAVVFHAWLAPRNVSLWLGAWVRGFCG
jgi:hypothetical protein